MINAMENTYIPEYVTPPGEFLQEYLDHYGMTQKQLAERTGLSPKTINEIVQAKTPITADTALKLERVLGRPAHFWSALEAQYQESLARAAERERLQDKQAWIERLPIKKMVEYGWVRRLRDPLDQLDELLRFFGVNSVDQWRVTWEGHQVAYRQTARFEIHAEAVSAWLRRGELEGQAIPCRPFDKAKFKAVLKEARALTREPPEVVQGRLIELCAAVGVAVVFVPELPKTGVSGATRWLTPEKALIQMSLRYKSDDHLWFTFFHEAGHVLLHGKKDVFIEGNGMDDEKEQEANRFAADWLIPPADLRHLLAHGRPTLARVEEFAEGLGIAPGIVVGRLQRERVYDHKVGNGLKRGLRWAAPTGAQAEGSWRSA